MSEYDLTIETNNDNTNEFYSGKEFQSNEQQNNENNVNSDEISKLEIYLFSIISAIFSTDSNLIKKSITISNSKDSLYSLLVQFASNQFIKTLFACKLKPNTGNSTVWEDNIINISNQDSNSIEKSSITYKYTLSSTIKLNNETIATVAFIKHADTLEFSDPLEQQIQIIEFSSLINSHEISKEFSIYNTVQSFLRSGMIPYIDAFTNSQNKNSVTNLQKHLNYIDTNRTGLPSLKQKFIELDYSLGYMKQKYSIPELSLKYHVVIQKALDEAREKNIHPSLELIPNDLLTDSSFLNSLQNNVNSWIKSIQAITNLVKDPPMGSARDELNFWLSLETTMDSVKSQIRSDGVLLTLNILQNAKRYHATTSFNTDTGLKEAFDLVTRYNLLIKDFPLDELISATTLEEVGEAIKAIFSHLIRKIKISPYPVSRALLFVESLSYEFDSKLHEIIHGKSLMFLDYNKFKFIIDQAFVTFNTWDSQVREFVGTAREVTRKRSEKFIPIKIKTHHDISKERLSYLSRFRSNHEQLQLTLEDVLKKTKKRKAFKSSFYDSKTHREQIENIQDILKEIYTAYDSLRDVDVFDISPAGTEQWVIAENSYNEHTNRAETSIIIQIRDQLSVVQSSEDMFKLFSRYNALLVRPKVRAAVHEYQQRLLKQVRNDLLKLYSDFNLQYANLDEYSMASLVDITPISGAIIWAKQMNNQLNNYMRRVEDILGEEWQNHVEGQKLESICNTLKLKLNPRKIFDEWLEDIRSRKLAIYGTLFSVARSRGSHANLTLRINFNPKLISLFKEVRNLQCLYFSVPHSIINLSRDTRTVYPYATVLNDALNLYSVCLFEFENLNEDKILLYGNNNEIHSLLFSSASLRWEYFLHQFNMKSFVRDEDSSSPIGSRQKRFADDFCKKVILFRSRIKLVKECCEKISEQMKLLKSCPFSFDEFNLHLKKIQKHVVAFDSNSCSNIDVWLFSLNKKIQSILTNRLILTLRAWLENFIEGSLKDENINEIFDLSLEANDLFTVSTVNVPIINFEIIMQNQILSYSPPIESAYSSFTNDSSKIINQVSKLKKIHRPLQQSVFSNEEHIEKLYDIPKPIEQVLICIQQQINERMSQVSEYLKSWLRFQALWDLDVDKLFSLMGSNLQKWLKLLQEVRVSRLMFDTSKSSSKFGKCVINYNHVQSRIISKYDYWQTELIRKFALELYAQFFKFVNEVKNERKNIENTVFSITDNKKALNFISSIEICSKLLNGWKSKIDDFKLSHNFLIKSRYKFPEKWIFYDQIYSEWESLNEIYTRKANLINQHLSALQLLITDEANKINDNYNLLINDWNENKPVSGSMSYVDVMNVLAEFLEQINVLKDTVKLIRNAESALRISPHEIVSFDEITKEVEEYKSLWNYLSSASRNISELRSLSWELVSSRVVRQKLQDTLESLRNIPSSYRNHSAFIQMQTSIKFLLKINHFISDLKTNDFKDRHWRSLFTQLQTGEFISTSSFTLGYVWDFIKLNNEDIIKEVIKKAQGEAVLELHIKKIKDFWNSYTIELVNFQNKCQIIRGWEDIFSKCDDDLDSLNTMKSSHYYKIFSSEAEFWIEKLTAIRDLFNLWMEVQRQWVYLEGIFNNNMEIQNLLPLDFSRFQNINKDFYSLLNKVYKSPLIIDVVLMPGIYKLVHRLSDLLLKTRKALSDYLERERALFPRFYFIGDDELLEIIGNSNDISVIQKHFKKLFTGVSKLEQNDENDIIKVFSDEGDSVDLHAPVSTHNKSICKWISFFEKTLYESMALLVDPSIVQYNNLIKEEILDESNFLEWIRSYPSQILILVSQIFWTNAVERNLLDVAELKIIKDTLKKVLGLLTKLVLSTIAVIERKKIECLITELVHQSKVVTEIINDNINAAKTWFFALKFYYLKPSNTSTSKVIAKIGLASFPYGYEFLGLKERLVRTPLTDDCYFALSQALNFNLGGSPYGPAGTGKTETVKSLGSQIGRIVLVFNCDDRFDFKSMGRILSGICQLGAWGCFDEFNRLDEKTLSAVSSQIEAIQRNISDFHSSQLIDICGRSTIVNSDTGIFVTLNPTYAGRSSLPHNIKKLFRSFCMKAADTELITEVMLYSQGFTTAKNLAEKIVPFFSHLFSDCSKQQHYDFGLRTIKSTLIRAGKISRKHTENSGKNTSEILYIVKSLKDMVLPKLVKKDAEIFSSLLLLYFNEIKYENEESTSLVKVIDSVINESGLSKSEDFVTKIVQLYTILQSNHGIILIGDSGVGKSTALSILSNSIKILKQIDTIIYRIDGKCLSKESLFGYLDLTTREWTDGLFTALIREIAENLRGQSHKNYWIIFDGDIDPEWVENLNSVLDDNKLLTLPNGERLELPTNVKIIFEVVDLKKATLATISRCGIIYMNSDSVSASMISNHYVFILKAQLEKYYNEDSSENFSLKKLPMLFSETIYLFLKSKCVTVAINQASQYSHIMEFSEKRGLQTFFALLKQTFLKILEYFSNNNLTFSENHILILIKRSILINMVIGFMGDSDTDSQTKFGAFLSQLDYFKNTDAHCLNSIVEYDVNLLNGEWMPWSSKVPKITLESQQINSSNTVIPTSETVRVEHILSSLLSEKIPLILCGPPGSGKTMSLLNALRRFPNILLVCLNFSNDTTYDLLIRSLEQHCEYRQTLNGTILTPVNDDAWVVLFCDEINLPAQDMYGSQPIMGFLRQLVERNGFWRISDKKWVSLNRIQFVGACNPASEVGRTAIPVRFLNKIAVLYVDYPANKSLNRIYCTLNEAALKCIPSLKGYATLISDSMIEAYIKIREHFTADIMQHYIFSPRELTRWVKGLYEVFRQNDSLDLETVLSLWIYEGLRLFGDRLVTRSEYIWTKNVLAQIIKEKFLNIDTDKIVSKPIFFSNWLTNAYKRVDLNKLIELLNARVSVFCEEEFDVPFYLSEDFVDHALRIDRVFKQPQGHMVLIGTSGSGRKSLARFVAWMNGLTVVNLVCHNDYHLAEFEADLRNILRGVSYENKKTCVILDETSILRPGFLERINVLLANAEVPGLFEGDELTSLISLCREKAQNEGIIVDSIEEFHNWFTKQIIKNFHVIITINSSKSSLPNKITSSALFNRCVIDWMGDWSCETMYEIATKLSSNFNLTNTSYSSPPSVPLSSDKLTRPLKYFDAIINASVLMHQSAKNVADKFGDINNTVLLISPRQYLDFIRIFGEIYKNKRTELENEQIHLNTGLDKLKLTVLRVKELRASFSEKQGLLEIKTKEANDTLQSMISQQNEAEQKKAASYEIQSALVQQEKNISTRREIVYTDLAKAQPAVLDAQKSVSEIKKQHLTEIRSMTNPPEAVKLTIESVCTLLGYNVDSWKSIQSVIRKDDFIPSIVNFESTQSISKSLKIKMHERYFDNPNYTFEVVNRASKACGPLLKWVVAQVNYLDILERVDPLRAEVEALESEATKTRARAKATEEMINELQEIIEESKKNYASIITQLQDMKQEMSMISKKVERSIKLIESLSSERHRWNEESKQYMKQIQYIVGDSLLSAATVSYGGGYDQHFRSELISSWKEILLQSEIDFSRNKSCIHYLSSNDDRLKWTRFGLTDDSQSLENVIIINHSIRYPLIIDPSGDFLEFISNYHKAPKLLVTSFYDSSVAKHLESALRFGTPILIQNAEKLNPILYPILNKEYTRTGGRTLVNINGQKVDVSQGFKLYLITRDASIELTDETYSRVNVVSFTMTKHTLKMLSMNKILQNEVPDIYNKKIEITNLESEYRVSIRNLEIKLLQALNQTEGNILDDDNLIQTLELLKTEVKETENKLEKVDEVNSNIEKVTNIYLPISELCLNVINILEALPFLNKFYQFSVEFILEIIDYVLLESKSTLVLNEEEKMVNIRNLLLSTFFSRISYGLKTEDRFVLSVLFLRFFYSSTHLKLLNSVIKHSDNMSQKEIDSILTQATSNGNKFEYEIKEIENSPTPEASIKLIDSHSNENENKESMKLKEKNVEMTKLFGKLMLLKNFRLDRIEFLLSSFCRTFLGSDAALYGSCIDLGKVADEVKPNMPIALCSETGIDLSHLVEEASFRKKIGLQTVSMGAEETFTLAEKYILEASLSGTWVLLKNIHLVPSWIEKLEQKIYLMKPNKNFRLFYSTALVNLIPNSFLKSSRILMFEPSIGIKSSLKFLYSAVSSEEASLAPFTTKRLTFLLAWLHGFIQERQRYFPVEWNNEYDIDESDFTYGNKIISNWFRLYYNEGKGNHDSENSNLPFGVLRTAISVCVYCCKVDDLKDRVVVDEMIKYLFSFNNFTNEFSLCQKEDARMDCYIVPECSSFESFQEWMEDLPEVESSKVLNLDVNDEKKLSEVQGKKILNKSARMISSYDLI